MPPATPSHATPVPLREFGIVAMLAGSAFLLLALGSYSPWDDAHTHASTDATVSNLAGRIGALAADLLLWTFGWVAYVLPVSLVAASVRMLRWRMGERWFWTNALIRVGGVALVALSVCILAHLHLPAFGALPAGNGGVVGASIVQVGLPALNWAGLTLVGLVVLVIGVQAAVGFSWLDVAEHIGKAVLTLAGRVGQMRRPRRPPLAEPSGQRVGGKRRKPRRVAPAVAERTEPVLAPPHPVAEPRAEPAVTDAPDAMAAPGEAAAEAAGAMPDLSLLEDAQNVVGRYSSESLAAMSRLLEVKLADFKVEAEVVSVEPGPVVTRFEIQPAAGVKVSRISGLAKDLARSLAVVSVRIVEIIAGKSVVGIEIPNAQREMVRLKEILDSPAYRSSPSPLTLVLGKDIAGVPTVADIAGMPHLLVAGTTGSGKSVGINAMLLSMLYKATPDELRLILVDPKMLELAVYDGIPHLLTPVVTDMKDAAQALHWCVGEMDRRYQAMAALGVRNLAGFNRRIEAAESEGKTIDDPLWPENSTDPAPPLARLPAIVVVIDEFADMMMIVGKKVEQLIARIAQKARAAGIHLVLATQRPSVDVITGLIKANIPARISFQVSSKIDSRTILDQGGAEQLLGHGDMLFLPPGTSTPARVHGAFVSDEEVHAVAADWKRRGAPDYVAEVLTGAADATAEESASADAEADDPLYDQAVAFVVESRRASISSVQRKLRIGYNRAARLIEAMEHSGLVSPMNGSGGREVLVPDRAAE